MIACLRKILVLSAKVQYNLAKADPSPGLAKCSLTAHALHTQMNIWSQSSIFSPNCRIWVLFSHKIKQKNSANGFGTAPGNLRIVISTNFCLNSHSLQAQLKWVRFYFRFASISCCSSSISCCGSSIRCCGSSISCCGSCISCCCSNPWKFISLNICVQTLTRGTVHLLWGGGGGTMH